MNIFVGEFLMNNCTNCGAQLAQGMKFCTKCGQQVVLASSMASAAELTSNFNSNPSVVALKRQSTNYFDWIKQSLFDPMDKEKDTQYFGFISFLLHALLMSFSVFIVENTFLEPIQKVTQTNRLTEDISKSMGMTMTTGLPLFGKLFFIAMLFYVIFVAVGYFSKKILVDPQAGLVEYTNSLARLSNALLILELAFTVFTFVTMLGTITQSKLGNAAMLIFLNMVIGGAVWSVSYVASILLDKKQMKWNKIYVSMLALTISNLLMWFVAKYIFDDVLKNHGQLIKAILTSFFGIQMQW